jgi:hypothetical protein
MMELALFFFILACGIGCVVCQVLMMINRKPSTKMFSARLLYNPLNMQIRGNYYLTKRGIIWRNISWTCFLLFVMGCFLIDYSIDR